jgi:beta-glucosidase
MKKVLLLSVCAICASSFAQLAVTPSLPDKPWTNKMWLPRFDAKRELAATGRYDVVFIGDSITHGWERRGTNVWAKNFADGKYRALNCGISGDRTEHVLWRLNRGQLDGASPKAIVLMIGTNNTGHRDRCQEPPTDTILGIHSILGELKRKFPKAKVVLHPIFPRGATTNDPMRVRNDLVNSVIRKFADGKRVIWCDFNSRMLTEDGVLEKSMMPDLLHPGEAGYQIWAEELKPYLDYALGYSKSLPAKKVKPAPTALPKQGPVTVIPDVKMYWLANGNPKVEPRIRNKRAEQCANVDRYYDAIWLGDSITHFWEKKNNIGVFADKFKDYRILNLGFGGDRTQNVLWNILHGGVLDGVHTRLVTLMIGTNNTWSDSAEDIAAGIAACVKAIRERQPQAKVILYTILPREVAHKRGERNFRRNKANVDEIMPKQTKINELIRPLADGKTVFLVDMTAKFTDGEGLPDIKLLPDGTHPGPEGYTVWADEVLPLFRQLIGPGKAK